ncbi:hypothetical protein JCM17380_09250 [Desulfosporosinus burensis]
MLDRIKKFHSLKIINQHPDSLTGYSIRVVKRTKNTDLPHFIMFGEQQNLTMPILNYNLEDGITVSRHTLVHSKSVADIILH